MSSTGGARRHLQHLVASLACLASAVLIGGCPAPAATHSDGGGGDLAQLDRALFYDTGALDTLDAGARDALERRDAARDGGPGDTALPDRTGSTDLGVADDAASAADLGVIDDAAGAADLGAADLVDAGAAAPDSARPDAAPPGPPFHVAPTGSDQSGDGSLARPWATPQRARDHIRSSLANQDLTTELHVYLRGGTYFLDRPLELDERDGGSNGFAVVYRSYPGEEAVLVGGVRVSGWQLDAGQIYRAHLPDVAAGAWRFNQLFANGVRQILARHPNAGYLLSESGAGQSRLQYRDGDIPPWSVGAEAQLYVWAEQDWFSNTVPIASISVADRWIALADSTLQPLGSDNRFFIQGLRAALDMPGEFFLDRSSGILYYWPTELPIEAQTIVAPALDSLVRIVGSSPTSPAAQIRIEGLSLWGTTFPDRFREIDGVWNQPAEQNRKGIIYLENARDVEIRGNRIANAGLSGVALNYHTEAVTLQGNLISECGYHGVLVTGADVGTVVDGHQLFDNQRHLVSDNLIHHCGRLVGHGGGVFMFQSGSNVVANNEIHSMPRYGICQKGAPRWSGMADSYGGVAVTWDNHWDFHTGRDNLFHANEIHRVICDSEDAGAISFWGGGKSNVVDGNRIHDLSVFVGRGIGQAIYLDDAADYFTVTNNLIFDIDALRACGVYAKGIFNRLENNYIILDRTAQSAIASYTMAGERADHHTYTRNIISLAGVGQPVYRFVNWSDDRVSLSDLNVFYGGGGPIALFNIPGDDTYASWQALGYDPNSLVADPLFVDAGARDFGLQPGSPAHIVGIDPIDTGAAGVGAGFTFDPADGSRHLSDPLDSWALVHTRTPGWMLGVGYPEYFEGDASRARRVDDALGAESIVWHAARIRWLRARLFHNPASDGSVRFFASSDGSSWVEVPTNAGVEVATENSWSRQDRTPDGPLPITTRYLKVEIAGGAVAWAPQLGWIELWE